MSSSKSGTLLAPVVVNLVFAALIVACGTGNSDDSAAHSTAIKAIQSGVASLPDAVGDGADQDDALQRYPDDVFEDTPGPVATNTFLDKDALINALQTEYHKNGESLDLIIQQRVDGMVSIDSLRLTNEQAAGARRFFERNYGLGEIVFLTPASIAPTKASTNERLSASRMVADSSISPTG